MRVMMAMLVAALTTAAGHVMAICNGRGLLSAFAVLHTLPAVHALAGMAVAPDPTFINPKEVN